MAALVEQGWQVVNFDRVPSSHSEARFIRTDFTDFGQVVEAFSGIDEVHRGVDAVVHLAAIPSATFAPNTVTFDNNLVSTFHQPGLGLQGRGLSCFRQNPPARLAR